MLLYWHFHIGPMILRNQDIISCITLFQWPCYMDRDFYYVFIITTRNAAEDLEFGTTVLCSLGQIGLTIRPLQNTVLSNAFQDHNADHSVLDTDITWDEVQYFQSIFKQQLRQIARRAATGVCWTVDLSYGKYLLLRSCRNALHEIKVLAVFRLSWADTTSNSS